MAWNPWRGMGDLPRDVWMLSFVTFINRAGLMALPFLVLYLTKNLGYSATSAGLTLTLYGLGALASAPFAGKLSDRIGPFLQMKISLLLSGALLLIFPFAQSFIAILGLTLLWAVASEAFRPASLAAIVDIVTPPQRKMAYSLNRLAINLGMSVGPLAGGFIIMISYPLIFWVDGATSLLAGILLVLTTRHHARHVAHAASVGLQAQRFKVLQDKRLLFFLFAIIPVVIVFFQHEGALPLFLVHDIHLPESAYGILFTVNTLLIVIFEVPLNIAMTHWPHRHALALGAFLIGAGFGATAGVSGFWSAALAVAIWTFGEMVFLPGAVAYMAEVAPEERRGEYMGMYQMTFSLGFTLSGWLGTFLLEKLGAIFLWAIMFLAGSLSAAMLWRIDRDFEKDSNVLKIAEDAP